MRLLSVGVLTCVFVCGSAISLEPQGRSESPQPRDQFFSGVVTDLSDTKVTVSRTVLGKESALRTFQITPETRIEGKPRVKAKVTVRFISDDDGDRALHIIVRAPQPKKQP